MPQHDALGLSPALDALIDGCLAGLEANLSGAPPALWDPHSKQDTPPSHYAYCSLALALHQRKPGSPKWQTALDAYLAIPKQDLGHHPFNRLLLLLLRDALDMDNPHAAERVSTALQRCPLARRYPSNNWTLLAQLCRILEGRTNARAHQRAVADFERLLTHWMTPAGGFIDYPAKPKDGKGSTPIAYHHKALFLTAVAVIYGGAYALAPRLQALLHWAIQWIDQGGLCGGFGRTNHGLFGDACLVASLILLNRSGACTDPNLQNALSRIAGRLLRQQREDGLIWLTPAGTTGWDEYMHLTVYDAWFASTLAWASLVRFPQSAQEIKWAEPSEGLFIDDTAGLLAWRAHSAYGLLEAMVSTTGQPPQGFSASEVELRYGGGTVFNLSLNGKALLPPPSRVEVNSLKQAPWLAGNVPIFEFDGRLYGFMATSSESLQQDSKQLVMQLSGHLVCLTLDTRSHSLLARLIDAFDWRFLGRRLARRRNLSRPSLPHTTCTLEFLISVTNPHLIQKLCINSRKLRTINFMNPLSKARVELQSIENSSTAYPCSYPNANSFGSASLTIPLGNTTFETIY